MNEPAPGLSRDFTVATFVIHDGRVLLLHHPKLRLWLPPGGHIDPPELPDEAAVREVAEEAGLRVMLSSRTSFDAADGPRQLARPEGIQLEDIAPGHQHIDLIYFARLTADSPVEPTFEAGVTAGGWYRLEELAELGASQEIQRWAARALGVCAE
jgi:8-oxo-dGTP pyrophosphatase MutT (NUDIX family)